MLSSIKESILVVQGAEMSGSNTNPKPNWIVIIVTLSLIALAAAPGAIYGSDPPRWMLNSHVALALWATYLALRFVAVKLVALFQGKNA